MLIPPDGARARAVRVHRAVLSLLVLVIVGGFAGYFIPFSAFSLDKVKLNEKKNLERINQDLLARVITIRRVLDSLQTQVGSLARRRDGLVPVRQRDGRPDEPKPQVAAMASVDELRSIVRNVEARWKRLDNEVEADKDYFGHKPIVLPVEGEAILSMGFGRQEDPFTGNAKWHNGLDFVAPLGTPVVATAHGTVVDIDNDKRWGKVVRIKHRNGFVTVYAHLHTVDIARHRRVKRGTKIGTVGNTGLTTGPHLHYEVMRNGTHADPETFLHPVEAAKILRTGPALGSL